MALKDFLAKSEAAAPKQFNRDEQQQSDRLQLIYMNSPVNQGFINFIPITALNGDEVKYLYDVDMFQVYTENEETKEKNWRWSRVYDRSDYIHEFTPQQAEQVDKLRGYCENLVELGYENDWVRTGKNFALIFGYVIAHTNVDGEVLVGPDSRKMAMLIIPSKNFAKAMGTMLSSLTASPAGEQVFDQLFSRNSSPRPYFLEMSMKQGSGFGYDIVVNCKGFDLLTQNLLTESEKPLNAVTIPTELIAKCTNTSAIFNGCYDETGDDWNQEYMDRFQAQIESELRSAVVSQSDAAKLPPLPDNPAMKNE